MSYNIEEITKEKFSKFGDFINPEEVQSTNINLNTTKSYFDLANIEIHGEDKRVRINLFAAKKRNFPLKIEIIEKDPNFVLIKFNQQVEHLCRTIGHVPIPPYLNRQDDETDKERYQTVFANKAFTESVAAPTASLHFDEQLFKSITEEFKTTTVSLAVGLGTFKPLSDEPMTGLSSLHEEAFYISDEAAESINQQLAKGKKIIAIGTTTLRALEAAWCCESKQIKSGKSSTNIFIKEGYEFKVVDTLITNFHLPQSSLLMLVSAFSSKDFIFEAYKHAIENNLLKPSLSVSLVSNTLYKRLALPPKHTCTSSE